MTFIISIVGLSVFLVTVAQIVIVLRSSKPLMPFKLYTVNIIVVCYKQAFIHL